MTSRNEIIEECKALVQYERDTPCYIDPLNVRGRVCNRIIDSFDALKDADPQARVNSGEETASGESRQPGGKPAESAPSAYEAAIRCLQIVQGGIEQSSKNGPITTTWISYERAELIEAIVAYTATLRGAESEERELLREVIEWVDSPEVLRVHRQAATLSITHPHLGIKVDDKFVERSTGMWKRIRALLSRGQKENTIPVQPEERCPKCGRDFATCRCYDGQQEESK